MTIRARSFLTLLAAAAGLSGARTIHFDPTYPGADSDGSEARPWKTLDRCFTDAMPGDVCLLEPGEYNLATPTGGSIGRALHSGTAAAPIQVRSRLAGSAAIGAWHRLDWTPTGSANLWNGRLRVPLAASIPSLQSVWSDRIEQDGIRLWYLSRRTALQEATWPKSPDLFPRTAILQPGSSTYSYNLLQLPPGDLAGAKAHVFRDDEQGALVRGVTSRSGSSTLSIDPYGNYDDLESYGGRHRVWLSNHPSLLDGSETGRWTTVPGTNDVRVANSFDPAQLDFVMQVSAVGPDLRGISHWQFRDILFLGVVPVTDPSSTGLLFEGNTFDHPGLSDGRRAFDATQATRGGFVVEGSGHQISRNSFSGCPLVCLEVHGSSIAIRNNTLVYTQRRAGAYVGTIHVLGPDVVVANNVLSELGGSGIVLNRNAARAVVRRNRIDHWARLSASRSGGIAAIWRSSAPVMIDSNLVVREARIDREQNVPRPNAALNLMFGRNLVFAHHNILDEARVGIRLGGWDDPDHQDENNSRSNSIFSNSMGSGLEYSWLNTTPAAVNPFSGTRFANNIFRKPMGLQVGVTGEEIVPYAPDGFLPGGTADHNLVPASDPLFVAPYADVWNYGLAAGSPAIDGGVLYTIPDGGFGFQGNAPDIGAVEFGMPWEAGIDPYRPPVSSTAFSMDDRIGWTIPVDQPYARSLDRTEGTAAFELAAAGYKLLESPAARQDALGGTAFVSMDALISTVQSNPWWVGVVQIYVDCPSRGIWNQWVGQWELTGRIQGAWQTLRLPLPTEIAGRLEGASFSDLKVRIAVNINPGSGPLKLDNLRFEP